MVSNGQWGDPICASIFADFLGSRPRNRENERRDVHFPDVPFDYPVGKRSLIILDRKKQMFYNFFKATEEIQMKWGGLDGQRL